MPLKLVFCVKYNFVQGNIQMWFSFAHQWTVNHSIEGAGVHLRLGAKRGWKADLSLKFFSIGTISQNINAPGSEGPYLKDGKSLWERTALTERDSWAVSERAFCSICGPECLGTQTFPRPFQFAYVGFFHNGLCFLSWSQLTFCLLSQAIEKEKLFHGGLSVQSQEVHFRISSVV